MHLYEIPHQYRELLGLLDEGEDESMVEAVNNAMSEIKSSLEYHAVNLIKVIRNIEADNLAAKSEIERLQKLSNARKKKAEKLKAMLIEAMKGASCERLHTELFTISLRKGSKSVEVLKVDDLDPEYVDVEVVTKPVKEEIKKGIEEGKINADVARIVIGQQTLQIK